MLNKYITLRKNRCVQYVVICVYRAANVRAAPDNTHSRYASDVYVMQTLKGKPKHLKTVDTNCFYCDNDLNVLDKALGMLDFESL